MPTKKRNGRGGVRPGAGRPRQVRQPVRLTVKLEQETLDALGRLAFEDGLPVSSYVRALLEEWVRTA